MACVTPKLICMNSNKPLVVVAGATGTGKTKLAVDLCLRFSGEVVNADSMQIYKGLNIATNKATQEEMCGVSQHMIDFLPPSVTNFNVINFRDKVLDVLHDIWSRNKLPVLVGGTKYYIESILWNVLLTGSERKLPITKFSDDIDTLKIKIGSLSNEELLDQLKSVDPVAADVVHPNDRKRLQTTLMQCERHGRPKSEMLSEQMKKPGGGSLGGPLRFKNTCIFWLRSDYSILHKRLDNRVDKMIAMGLKDEVIKFYDNYYEEYKIEIGKIDDSCEMKSSTDIEQTFGGPKGIFQSIGLKEFLPFWQLSPEQRNCAEGEKMFDLCLDQLKTRTRQYAKTQDKWVTSRLLKSPDRQVPPIYALDVSDPDIWEDKVKMPAFEIISSFLSGQPSSHKPLECKMTDDEYELRRDLKIRYCSACSMSLSGHLQWKMHCTSRKHRHFASKLKRQQQKLVETLDQIVASDK